MINCLCFVIIFFKSLFIRLNEAGKAGLPLPANRNCSSGVRGVTFTVRPDSQTSSSPSPTSPTPPAPPAPPAQRPSSLGRRLKSVFLPSPLQRCPAVPVPADHLTGIFTRRRVIQNRRDHRSLQPPLASDVSPVPHANDSRQLPPPVCGSVQVRAPTVNGAERLFCMFHTSQCRVCIFTVPAFIFMDGFVSLSAQS